VESDVTYSLSNSPLEQRALRVALLARALGLLADRPCLALADPADREAAVLGSGAYPRSILDCVAVVESGPVDLICAEAIRVLRGRVEAGVLEVIGTLGGIDPDYLVAIAWCLSPPQRRKIRDRHYAWGIPIGDLEPYRAEALREVEELHEALDDRDPLTRPFARLALGICDPPEVAPELALAHLDITTEEYS